MATDTPQDIKQDYHYQVDQQVSVNSFLDVEVGGENVRFQVTNRYGATPEKIVKTVRANIEAFAILRETFPRALVQASAPQVVQQATGDNPEVKSFTADRMSVEMKDGKFYYKVIGAPFTKFGVNVWDEVLQASGITIDHANPGNPPNIAGWKAEYIEKENNGKMVPAKVTRLLPGKAPF